jgi:hypothetical protein
VNVLYRGVDRARMFFVMVDQGIYDEEKSASKTK